MDTGLCLMGGPALVMLRLKTIQKEQKARTEYAVAIPLRSKEDEALFSSAVRLPRREASRPSARKPEERKSFFRNSFGIFSQIASLLLIGLFLFNPVLDVYADEIPLIVPGESAVPEVAEAPEPEMAAVDTGNGGLSLRGSVGQSSVVATGTAPVAATETNADGNQGQTFGKVEGLSLVATTTGEQGQTFAVAQGLSLPTMATTTETVPEAATTTEISTDDETIPIEEILYDAASTTTEEAVNTEEEDTASSTEAVETPEVLPETPVAEKVREVIREVVREVIIEREAPAPAVNVIEKKYLFRENECMRLDDGGFYCAPPEMASTTVASNASLPRVFVENDGDKEIFFEDAKGKVQITHNDTDDDAPSYDKQSGFVSWHSLVKGRFQILFADMNASTTEGSIRQITNTEHNNTDPKIRGKSVAWQGWVDGNWEIFYIKDATAEPLNIQQITTNENPDMFPIISDSFITWQSFSGGSWRVFVYSIENGQISQISQPEAGRYENPRFALLFENRKENGEVETVGYDVLTGKEIPINSPHRAPSELPEQKEKDQAVPVPSGQTGMSTSPLKNPGKDDEGRE